MVKINYQWLTLSTRILLTEYIVAIGAYIIFAFNLLLSHREKVTDVSLITNVFLSAEMAVLTDTKMMFGEVEKRW